MSDMSLIKKNLLEKVADLHAIPDGAYNLRENGKSSVGVIDFDSSTRASRFSYLFRKETARFISSFLMGCGRESDEDITQTSRIFFENYNAVCSKKYRPEALKKYITDFFASTRRK